jgi:hypothetical protein
VTSPFPDLAPDEDLLSGSWTETRVGAVHDEVDRRILWLASHRLTLLGVADGGWRQLYRDARDGRLWELTFPQGSLHGGGPRRLAIVDDAVARERYGIELLDV